MKIGMSKNEYGTPTSVHICNACGGNFTVVPAIPDEAKGWENCLGKDCKSYDESRDADKLFDGKCKKIKRKFANKSELLSN